MFAVEPGAVHHATAADPPPTYSFDYPIANQFVPPVEGFFEDIASTIGRAGRRTFRHQPNGGYGLPIADRASGANLLHLGADVGWYRVGEPVVAVANGIVRLAQQPAPKEAKEKSGSSKQPKVLQWGGVVAIEHHLTNDTYVTTVYGHLDTKLLVSTGDIVKAGQPLGRIGATRVNGGYKPHLHFGVRKGRMAEPGRELLTLHINGQPVTLRIRQVAGDVLILDGAERLPGPARITVNEKTFELRRRDDSAETEAAILWHIQPTSFAIEGYATSTDGWLDSAQFLRNPLDD